MNKRHVLLYAGILMTVAVIIFVLIYQHASWINGPFYWKWPWRKIEGSPLYGYMFVGFIPFLLAQWLYHKKKINLYAALFLIMFSMFSMELIALGSCTSANFDFTHPLNTVRQPITQIVKNKETTSYFTVALTVTNVKQFLASFHERLYSFPIHASIKPPGTVLYYVLMLRIFGVEHDYAAFIGGLIIGILATLTIPATFFLTRLLTKNSHAAFRAASFIAITPSMMLFFPEFDQIFPVLTCLLIYFFVLALEKNSIWHSIIFGLILSACLFITWNVLVLGAFFLMYSLLFIMKNKGNVYPIITRHFSIIFLTVTISYLLLWIATGYDLIATFYNCLSIQKPRALLLNRPYPYTVPFDIFDFVFGAGCISLLIAIKSLLSNRHSKEFWIICICLLQIIVVAVTGILPVETARVWIFMQPLLLIPVGMELALLPVSFSVFIYFLTWALSTVICQNMIFIRY